MWWGAGKPIIADIAIMDLHQHATRGYLRTSEYVLGRMYRASGYTCIVQSFDCLVPSESGKPFINDWVEEITVLCPRGTAIGTRIIDEVWTIHGFAPTTPDSFVGNIHRHITVTRFISAARIGVAWTTAVW